MIKGLNKDQVEQSRKLHGDNIIHEAEQETFWDKFKGAFDDPMIKLLLVWQLWQLWDMQSLEKLLV